ncbi:MAG: GDSL-type esterase/lipase family protein [Oscillospiraceae bacterium]|nr:GDSL-type esterase/lipase family protein [Oscillospiraceae bacterium]
MNKNLKPALIVLGGLAILAIAGVVSYSLASDPLPPKAAEGGILVACVGDSITFGSGVKDKEQDAYPAQLRALLGEEYQVLNCGVSGRTALSSGDRPYVNTRRYRHSMQAAPDIVLIMLGTNDSKPYNWNAIAYEADLARLAEGYMALPNEPEVYLLQPPACFENKFEINPAIVRDEVCPLVRSVAAQTGARVIDIHSATAARPELFPDGVHPDEAGCGVIAQEIYKALTSTQIH